MRVVGEGVCECSQGWGGKMGRRAAAATGHLHLMRDGCLVCLPAVANISKHT